MLRQSTRAYLVRGLEEFWKQISRIDRLHRVRNVVGDVVFRVICRYQEKQVALYTRFFRNPPLLDALTHLQLNGADDGVLRVAILGCSDGAEVYSVVQTLRLAYPGAKVKCIGLDVSEAAVLAAREGIWASDSNELEGVPAQMLDIMFDRRDGALVIKESLREGVIFRVGDACDQRLLETIGPQDLVMANNFLVHLPDKVAEACISNIEKLIVPGGVFVVWGVNLNIKTRVIKLLGLKPLLYNIEKIYQADQAALKAWPLKWWALEPSDFTRSDWDVRYCTIFQKLEKVPQMLSAPSFLAS